jgi:chitin synthase
MDDQARRSPKKSDHTMVEAFAERWNSHSAFKLGNPDRSGFSTLTDNQFSGPLTHSYGGFIDRKIDALSPDFVSLLRGNPDSSGGENSGSIDPFIKGLFSAKAIAVQAPPRDEDTIVAAQQPVKPMRALSTRRKITVKWTPTMDDIDEEEREDEDANAPAPTGGTPCIASEFRSALDTLSETLEETRPWYIFCINPTIPSFQISWRGVLSKGKSGVLAQRGSRRGVRIRSPPARPTGSLLIDTGSRWLLPVSLRS